MSSLVKYEHQKQELDYFRSLASIASKGGTNTMTPDVLMNIMLTARDLGISPMKAINGGFYIVNGKISMSTALMADRIRKEGHSIKIPEWTREKCVIIGIRKDNGDSIKFEFTMEDASSAGLTNSPTWKKFPKQMLYNRAMSTMARTLFPDVVGNAYSEDEKWDIMNIPAEKRPEEDPDSNTVTIGASSPSLPLLGTEMDTLTEHMAIAGLDTKQLDSYLKVLSTQCGQSVDKIVQSALQSEKMVTRFSESYAKHLKTQALNEATA